MANNPTIKFHSFLCFGLNHRLLHEWVLVLTVDKVKETMGKFYESWVFVQAHAPDPSQGRMPAMSPLATARCGKWTADGQAVKVLLLAVERV